MNEQPQVFGLHFLDYKQFSSHDQRNNIGSNDLLYSKAFEVLLGQHERCRIWCSISSRNFILFSIENHPGSWRLFIPSSASQSDASLNGFIRNITALPQSQQDSISLVFASVFDELFLVSCVVAPLDNNVLSLAIHNVQIYATTQQLHLQSVLDDFYLVENNQLIIKKYVSGSSTILFKSTVPWNDPEDWDQDSNYKSGDLEKSLELKCNWPLSGFSASTGPSTSGPLSFLSSLQSMAISTPSKLIKSMFDSAGSASANPNQPAQLHNVAVDCLGLDASFFKDEDTFLMRPPLVFVLYMDGSLRVWNLLFTSIVAQLDLGIQSNPSLKAKPLRSLQLLSVDARDRVLNVNLCTYFGLEFVICQLSFNTEKGQMNKDAYTFKIVKRLSNPVSDRLVDFLVISKDEPIEDTDMDMDLFRSSQAFSLFTLWDTNIQSVYYTCLQLEKQHNELQNESTWITCTTRTLPSLTHPPLLPSPAHENFQDLFASLLSIPNSPYPLELVLEASQYSSNAVVQTLSQDESTGAQLDCLIDVPRFTVSQVLEHVLGYIVNESLALQSSSASATSSKDALEESWYRFIATLDSLCGVAHATTNLQFINNSVFLFKKGCGAPGLLRDADVSESLLTKTSLNTALPPALSFRNRDCMKNSLAVVDYLYQSGHFTTFEHDLNQVGLIKLLFCKSGEGTDEITLAVFDYFNESGLDRGRLRYLCERGGNNWLEYSIIGFCTAFQHADYYQANTTASDSMDADDDVNAVLDSQRSGLISNAIVSIIRNRFKILRDLFFATCIIIHTCPDIERPSKTVFLQLQSLVGCYWRLNWLASRKPASLNSFGSIIEELLVKWYPFDEECALLPLPSSILQTVSSFLSWTGWARSRPISSLEECKPVLHILSIVFDKISSNDCIDFLNSIPLASPGTLYLTGLAWIKSNNTEKAQILFEKAAGNIDGDTDLDVVVPGFKEVSIKSSAYYQHLVQICSDSGALSLSIHFGKLALAVASPSEYLYINKHIFSSSIECGDFKSAYEAVISCPDPSIKRDCLGLLISELCEAGNLDYLCGGFSFPGLQKEVEKSLHFKTRTEGAYPSKPSKFHRISYAYFIYCGDYRNAALVMFRNAVKLYSLNWSDRYGEDEIKSVFTRMSQCFLSALNALSLLENHDAYLKTTEPVSIYPKNGPVKKSFIIRVEDIRKFYYLSLAKLCLFSKVAHLRMSFSLPDPNDIYSAYCSSFEIEKAIEVASLFTLDLEKAVVSCVDIIVRIINNLPFNLPDQEEFSTVRMNPLSRGWVTLRNLLSHDSSALQLKYHERAISNILKSIPNYKLPQWLLEPIQRSHGEILIRIYLSHNRIDDALAVGLTILENSRRQLVDYRNCSRWVPLTMFEQLLVVLKQVDHNSADKLLVALADYKPAILGKEH